MIIDSHVHYSLNVDSSEILSMMEKAKVDKCCLVSLIDSKRSSETLDCLRAKLLHDNIYVFGSLDVSLYYTEKENLGAKLVKHVENLLECGIDGIKMIEGKPTTRLRHPICDFDSIYFDEFFKFMEEKQIPICMHLNDPEEFWDIEKVPKWALNNGWFYKDSGVDNILQYKQIENVLTKYPNLVITFAHFMFLSNELDYLQSLFDKFKNLRVDITPGIEMYTNFEKNYDKAKKFFEKNSSRILYGTDICGSGCEGDESFNDKDINVRTYLCKNYLTQKDKIVIKGDKDGLFGEEDIILSPLNLDKEHTDKIFYQNFLDIVKNKNKVDPVKCYEEALREKQRIKILSEKRNFTPDYSIIDYLITFFKERC